MTTAPKIQLPYLEDPGFHEKQQISLPMHCHDTGLDEKKSYTPREWTE